MLTLSHARVHLTANVFRAISTMPDDIQDRLFVEREQSQWVLPASDVDSSCTLLGSPTLCRMKCPELLDLHLVVGQVSNRSKRILAKDAPLLHAKTEPCAIRFPSKCPSSIAPQTRKSSAAPPLVPVAKVASVVPGAAATSALGGGPTTAQQRNDRSQGDEISIQDNDVLKQQELEDEKKREEAQRVTERLELERERRAEWEREQEELREREKLRREHSLERQRGQAAAQQAAGTGAAASSSSLRSAPSAASAAGSRASQGLGGNMQRSSHALAPGQQVFLEQTDSGTASGQKLKRRKEQREFAMRNPKLAAEKTELVPHLNLERGVKFNRKAVTVEAILHEVAHQLEQQAIETTTEAAQNDIIHCREREKSNTNTSCRAHTFNCGPGSNRTGGENHEAGTSACNPNPPGPPPPIAAWAKKTNGKGKLASTAPSSSSASSSSKNYECFLPSPLSTPEEREKILKYQRDIREEDERRLREEMTKILKNSETESTSALVYQPERSAGAASTAANPAVLLSVAAATPALGGVQLPTRGKGGQVVATDTTVGTTASCSTSAATNAKGLNRQLPSRTTRTTTTTTTSTGKGKKMTAGYLTSPACSVPNNIYQSQLDTEEERKRILKYQQDIRAEDERRLREEERRVAIEMAEIQNKACPAHIYEPGSNRLQLGAGGEVVHPEPDSERKRRKKDLNEREMVELEEKGFIRSKKPIGRGSDVVSSAGGGAVDAKPPPGSFGPVLMERTSVVQKSEEIQKGHFCSKKTKEATDRDSTLLTNYAASDAVDPNLTGSFRAAYLQVLQHFVVDDYNLLDPGKRPDPSQICVREKSVNDAFECLSKVINKKEGHSRVVQRGCKHWERLHYERQLWDEVRTASRLAAAKNLTSSVSNAVRSRSRSPRRSTDIQMIGESVTLSSDSE